MISRRDFLKLAAPGTGALAFVTAVLVSTFITRRIVSPVQQVKEVSAA